MIEIIKEAGEILKDLPDLAIWILMGILFYKVFIIGGIIAVIKLAINKCHSIMELSSNNKVKPKEVITKYQLEDYFITDAMAPFKALITELRMNGKHNTYIHKSDVEFLLDAIREKKERELNN
tara:strand:+ start:3303 stop:3671 length:369 start_codon:yes stop_codon:yes gene_type:complete